MKNKKKKLPDYFIVISFGIFFLCIYITANLDLPGPLLCSERVGICDIHPLGTIIRTFTSLNMYLGIIFAAIINAGFSIVIKKKRLQDINTEVFK